jgi:hypothetical protein
MKAEELRIGNYVKDIHSSDKGYWKVVSLTERLCKFGVYRIKYDQLVPIPLTEEWLLKFGFIHTVAFHLGNFMVGWNADDFVNDVYSFAFDHKILCKLKYVHQLQNLYYALTGTELLLNP